MPKDKKTWKASEIRALVTQKQHFHALNHSIKVDDIEDDEVKKAAKEYLAHCKNFDKVIKAAIAREVAVNSQ